MGQVQFIFSDKTGTLTQNKMEFKKISVDGVVYGTPEASEGVSDGMCESSVKLIQKSIKKDAGQIGHKAQGAKLREFFELLAVCHTCVVERDPKTSRTQY